MKKVAVVLCGSGHKDGSEIREAVGTLWALSLEGAEAVCFAPDGPQADVINTLSGEPQKGQSRNMLVEAARIARGKISPLSKFDAEEFQAVILPGGFGAAKNLCTFALKGSQATVLPELKMALEKMYEQKKPIGAICIAPAIVALTFKGKGFQLTVGEPCEASQEIEKLGHDHVSSKVSECVTDAKHRIVTTPAYMFDAAPLSEVFEGIHRLVKEVVRLG